MDDNKIINLFFLENLSESILFFKGMQVAFELSAITKTTLVDPPMRHLE